jgi:hypothetical protein
MTHGGTSPLTLYHSIKLQLELLASRSVPLVPRNKPQVASRSIHKDRTQSIYTGI